MSHALLLRLFLSPSFFSVHVALRYLRRYADNIGITYYLTHRLRELETQELRDVWEFICHLLVTIPSKSRALECFVIEIAQKSTHIAMITLWFMQAALKDLSLDRRDSQSFVICHRILHHCHEIIFSDLPASASAPYATLSVPFKSRFVRRKIKHHIEPVLIGAGVVLAGAPGMPQLTGIIGEVAIEQGRMDDDGNGFKSIQVHDDQIAQGRISSQSSLSTQGDDDELEESQELGKDMSTENSPSPDSSNRAFQGTGDGPKTGSLARRRTIAAAQTAPTLLTHLSSTRRMRSSEDPLGQLDSESSAHATTPYQSSPSISSSKLPSRSPALNLAETLLQRYDTPSQIHLLRNHYCRAEVQFLLSLESISNRLLVVPRPARVSALRAELTALNHKLPAEVCIPLWCSSSDEHISAQGISQPHHRIVRIPPGESVVLNSAERAPYLLLIEILNDDLDFDPSKRGNKEVLKKIVMKEQEREGISRDLTPFSGSTTPNHYKPKSNSPNGSDVLEQEVPKSAVVVDPATPTTPSSYSDGEEEIDLVEQLFGTEHSLRSRPIDLSESIMLHPTPKNKELDMAAWSRSSSIPPSPAVGQDSPVSRYNPMHSVFLDNNHSYRSQFSTPETQVAFPDEGENGRILSLDDYSERMRTAAIMLAQLNANLLQDPMAGVSLPGMPTNRIENLPYSGAMNWLTGSSDQPQAQPSPASGQPDHSQPVPTRMRMQYSEASAIRDRIMKEMLALEEERMQRMRENREADGVTRISYVGDGKKTADDEDIIRRELSKVDPSAVVFSESWTTKKSRIRHSSPYGHLANWDCFSVIVKTGGDLRQEHLAVQLIQEFERIWREEKCQCWLRHFRILITGSSSGLVETITDSISIHSIKKAEYARRLAEGKLGHVTLFDHFKATYGDPSSAKFARARRNFAKSLAGYSLVTYLLQIKDRHNGNILLDRDGHLIHIDFGFMLSNTPGNIGFEAAPFKLPPEYIEVLGGVDSTSFLEFRRLFHQGFEASRKHCDRIITLVELMQKDSTLPCFAALGEQTASQLRDRFQLTLTHSLVGEYVDRLIDSSLGSNWTRLYDSYQYYSQSIL